MGDIIRCPSWGKINRLPAVAAGAPVSAAGKTSLPWILDAVGGELDGGLDSHTGAAS